MDPKKPLKDGGVKETRPAPAKPSGDGGMAGEAQEGGASVSEETGEPARQTDKPGGMIGEG